MFHLFSRRHIGVELRVRSRSETAHASRPVSVDISGLAPAPAALLPSYAYLQLTLVDFVTAKLADIDDPDARARAGAVAVSFYSRFERLREVFDDVPGTTFDAQLPGREPTDSFWARLSPASWQERLLSGLIVGGLCDDFEMLLLREVRSNVRSRIRAVVQDRAYADAIVDILHDQCERIPDLADNLGLWGRRLVGDALLLCRARLELTDEVRTLLLDDRLARTGDAAEVVSQLEAVRGDMLVAHSERMGRLGLTA